MTETQPKYSTDKWPEVLAALKTSLSKAQYSHFRGSTATLEPGGSLTIYLRHTVKIEAIEHQLGHIVRRCITSVYDDRPFNYQLSFPALPEPIPPPPPIRDTSAEFATLMIQERAEKDFISFKRIFATMTGDTLAGLVLSNLIFWYMPNKKGDSKLRVHRDGHYWIARTRDEWQTETTIKPRQLDRVIKRLIDLGLVVKANYRFNGLRTMHLRIDESAYVNAYHKAIRE